CRCVLGLTIPPPVEASLVGITAQALFGRSTATYRCWPERQGQKIPPSFLPKSDRPIAPSAWDQDYADYRASCRTRRSPAAWSRLSGIAGRPSDSSSANESGNSP